MWYSVKKQFYGEEVASKKPLLISSFQITLGCPYKQIQYWEVVQQTVYMKRKH